jgi:hypothetical protein
MQLIGIGLLAENFRAVIFRKGRLNCVHIVVEIQHERVVLQRMRPV